MTRLATDTGKLKQARLGQAVHLLVKANTGKIGASNILNIEKRRLTRDTGQYKLLLGIVSTTSTGKRKQAIVGQGGGKPNTILTSASEFLQQTLAISAQRNSDGGCQD